MTRTLTCLSLLFALGGCATAGSLGFVCPGFTTSVGPGTPFAIQPPLSGLEQDIHSGARLGVHILALPATGDDPFIALFSRRYAHPAAQAVQSDGMLLLSGGGQWGAFGAAFLSTLHDQGQLPHFIGISGISTGALQALAIGASQGGGGNAAYDAMVGTYRPGRESDIVSRRPFLLAAITGSVAGLKPLRARMNAIVCATAETDPAKPCLIDNLKTLNIPILLGFVDATSGAFEFVDAVAIAKHAHSRKEARDCLVGAALASSAMPVFLQQVRINGRAYYDGGVRESVFEARIATADDTARQQDLARRRSLDLRASAPPPVPLYVVRNGPTEVAPLGANDKKGPNAKADALTAAMRAEPIIVNQIEVGSIAALRLADPEGEINLVTADGWNGTIPNCPKPPKIMFDPAFMRCLQAFGQTRARMAEPWTRLTKIPLPEAAATGAPAS